MDRNYTIHEHDGVKFINLSGRDIVTECGSEYPPEMTEYVVTNESREDVGTIYPAPVNLKTRSSLLFNALPDNVSAAHMYTPKMSFTELIHLPHPGELEWINSLPDDVLVLASPKISQTYGYPVCMFRTKKGPKGSYHIPTAVVWCKIQ